MWTPFRRSTIQPASDHSETGRVLLEALEVRKLLSAAASVVVQPELTLAPAATTTTIDGYTPAQIKKAYGFDQLTLNGITGDGTGQTIAIVDAYNDPNIQNDLAVFDQKFGLAAASLTVVNQNGGASLPATDAGWAAEISLDVEWAHAIAPEAKILLVEARSSSLTDLLAGVNEARNAAGVSVVSMSWGTSEFFKQTTYDHYFTTPAGHQGVTFVAAAGDSGVGPQWPSSSSNVLSVGGTTLTLADSTGAYGSETTWSSSSGGYSSIESQPTYQQSVQATGARSAPDVSYNANPNTGFAVYDSVPYQDASGWSSVGGTSAGAPQWAALIAIADQGRTQNGLGTLDGASQTLPMLYSLYSAASSTTSTGATAFNDITSGAIGSGNNGGFRGFPFSRGSRGGGLFDAGTAATTGYDTATGLGTPKANAVVQGLIGATQTATTAVAATSTQKTANASAGKRSKRAKTAFELVSSVATAAARAPAAASPQAAPAIHVEAGPSPTIAHAAFEPLDVRSAVVTTSFESPAQFATATIVPAADGAGPSAADSANHLAIASVSTDTTIATPDLILPAPPVELYQAPAMAPAESEWKSGAIIGVASAILAYHYLNGSDDRAQKQRRRVASPFSSGPTVTY